ncbi:hypothetical protein BDN72DRAFT_850524 [Pluteus cervinus]|uniref:Uncharacterized protein n=1 Tax=Pluteus cervinus TaxID=181527 RepID=A0ACD3A456_9AGAR|nr:hypothetical protein BDN72DRAFT_850524 [Pluteus cervinus]
MTDLVAGPVLLLALLSVLERPCTYSHLFLWPLAILRPILYPSQRQQSWQQGQSKCALVLALSPPKAEYVHDADELWGQTESLSI